MGYTVIVRGQAERELDGLRPELRDRVLEKLEQAASYPEHFLEWVSAYGVHRLRVGKYRVFCDLGKDEERLVVLTVRHREDAYEGW